MHKKLVLLLIFFLALYADGLTKNQIAKFKNKYGWNEAKILRAIEKKGFELTEDSYFELEELGFSEPFIDAIMTKNTIKQDALPQRILQHYRKQKTAPEISALIIGINNYKDKDKLPYLHAPRTDAEEFAKGLLSLGVLPSNIHLLTDENATKKNIADKIEKSKDAQGTLYLFFSGHGLSIEGNFYIACHDTSVNDIANTAYATADMKNSLQKMKSNHAVILIDACHSGASKGAIFNIKPKKRPDKNQSDKNQSDKNQSDKKLPNIPVTLGMDQQGNKMLRNLESIEKPIFLMTSCGATEYSWQGAKHSLFTSSLLEALSGKADQDKNNIIDTMELSEYIRKTVIRKTKGQQKPDFSKSRGWEWKHNTTAGIKILNSEWAKWQQEMQKKYDIAIATDKSNIAEKKKLEAWQNFNSLYLEKNNPESQEDEKLMLKANEKVQFWQKRLQRLIKLEITPIKDSCETNSTFQFNVSGFRANGECYTPVVLWKAKNGKINANGLFSAPNIATTSKIMAQSKHNKKIRAIVSIKIEEKYFAPVQQKEILPDLSSMNFYNIPTKLGDRTEKYQEMTMQANVSVFANNQLIQNISRSQGESFKAIERITQQFNEQKNFEVLFMKNSAFENVGQQTSRKVSPLEGNMYKIIDNGNFFSFFRLDGNITYEEKEKLRAMYNKKQTNSRLDLFFKGKTFRVGEKLDFPIRMANMMLGFQDESIQVSKFSLTLQNIIHKNNMKFAVFKADLIARGKQDGVQIEMVGSGHITISENSRNTILQLKGPLQMYGETWQRNQYGQMVKLIIKGTGYFQLTGGEEAYKN